VIDPTDFIEGVSPLNRRSVETRNGNCTYCGERRRLTRDHVPPRSIFPDPKPANLITVPACHDCNDAFKLDDEYFRTFVITGNFQNLAARNLWDRKIIGSPNAETIRQILRRSMKDFELRSAAGLYLGNALAVCLDAQRTLRIAARIVLGLWWHHYRTRPEPSIKIYAGRIWKLDGMEAILSACRKSSIGADVFAYAHGVPPEDTNQSVWFLQFFGGLMFFVFAVRSQQIESEWMFEVARASLMWRKADG
jgi:hypothetical protein